MTQKTPSPFARPDIGALALFGLSDPPGWGAIRAAQLNAAGDFALFLLAANLFCAAIVALIFAGHVPAPYLASWGALVAAAAMATTFRRLSVTRHLRGTRLAIRDTVLDGIAQAAVWTVPLIAFAPQAGAQAALAMWIVVALLMAASALALAALPMAAISFLGLIGTASAVTAARMAGPGLAGAALIFALLLILASVARGKAIAALRAHEIALGERDATLDMLLGEGGSEGSRADWLWETDPQRRIVNAGPRFAAALGHTPEAIEGRLLLELLAGPAWEAGDLATGLHRLAVTLQKRERFRELLLPVNVGERESWWKLSASPRYDEIGRFAGFRGVGSDVTEQRESSARIARMARYDALTGLPNRLLVNETMAETMAEANRRGRRAAFMMIDLDRFKAVNDTLGHPVGDRLLGQVAKRLARLTGDGKMTGDRQISGDRAMIGRLGGDEFAVVIGDASDSAWLDALAGNIIETLSRPYEVDRHTLYIGASIGIAIGPRDGRTADMLIRSADLALYRSKDAGGGIFHAYAPELHAAAEERRVLEIALRSALEQDELHLVYQPVVAAGSGALAGFEALLRWLHPDHGEIAPARFIPLAEDARLIVPIGEWVLRTACAEAARWQHPAPVAVNVSAEQLDSPDFVTLVAQVLATSGLAPERLELEVTEAVFLREATGTMRVLDALLGLGVRLSLDDFGTGHCALGHLSRAGFSTIKIDRGFIVDAARGVREATAIVRAAIALADSLDMTTTAEGVESAEELATLRTLGCTRAQGHYFSRPLPVAEARALVAGGDRSAQVA